MEQTVYGDILFFVNFCMDFQCLFLTAKLLRRPFRLWRSVIFAAVGALYACVALFLAVSGIWAFLADCAVCFLMCAGAFWRKEEAFWRLLVPFALYFGVSFAVGGVISGMGSLLAHIEAPIGLDDGEISSVGFFLLAAVGGIATFLWGRFCQRRAKGRRVTLTVEWAGKRLVVEGLVDTGNLLRDPVGGKSVVLLKKERAKDFLPARLLAATERGHESAVAELPAELARRIRWVPASTAVGRGLLLAVSPDQAFLDVGKGNVAVELLLAPVILSEDLGECEALLPAELIVE
ncbi:MAG: hypothetical protein E7585_01420 [Ruminococcaceae bacterium]|nr:hypothetical protein [Oscillospiraceae bacterium]